MGSMQSGHDVLQKEEGLTDPSAAIPGIAKLLIRAMRRLSTIWACATWMVMEFSSNRRLATRWFKEAVATGHKKAARELHKLLEDTR